jgi:hypothetical protein
MKYTGKPIIIGDVTYGTENAPWGYWDTKKGLKKWIKFIKKSNLSIDSEIKKESLERLKKQLSKLKK